MTNKLLSDISSGDAVLFLGAGAVFGSTIGMRKAAPLLGDGLRDKLQSHFFPDEGATRLSLKRVCSNIQNLMGQPSLHQNLVDLLNPVNPSKALQVIPKITWQTIYTVNVDDSLERTYDLVEDKAQKLIPIVLPQDKAAQDRTTQVSYYKLHGCLRHPDSNVIFSHRDYTESREKNLKMFSSLTADLCDFPFIFIGFSLEDDDFQDVWESVKRYLGSSRRSAATYLIQPKATKSFVDAMALENVCVIDKGVEDFFPWLEANLPKKPPSIAQRICSRAAPIQELIHRDFGKNIDAELVDQINRNFEFVKQIPSRTLSSRPSRFLLGAPPAWDDIKSSTPILRDIESDINDELFRWVEHPHFQTMLIIGGAGYGKSTLLKQIADKATKLQKNLELLFFRQNGDLEPTYLSEYSKAIQVPLIVFIDDIYKHANSLHRLKIDAETHKLQILVIGATRSSDWSTARIANAFDIQNKFELPRLSVRESRLLAAVMKTSGKLANSKQHISLVELADYYYVECEKHLLAGLMTSVSDESGEFEAIISNEYFRIQNQEAKTLYIAVALIHSLGLLTPATLACHIIGIDITDYHKSIAPILDSTIIESLTPPSGDLMFSTQQRVIAEALIHEIMRPDNTVELILTIAKSINPHQQEQYNILLRLYHQDYLRSILTHIGTVRSCFQQLEEQFPSDPFIKQHYAIFESQEKNFEKAHQLINDALTERGRHPHLLNTQANILLKEAQEEPDRDKAEFLFASGVKLLRERIERDSDKEIHLLSLIDRQIGWCQRRDLTESQRLATLENAQSDLDRVKPLYPNSSEISTAEAKLNLQLDHIPQAQALLERSVKLDGSNTRARILLARMLLKNNNQIANANQLTLDGLKYDPQNYGLLKLRLDCVKKLNETWPNIRKALVAYLSIADKDIYERIFLIKGCIEATDYAFALKELSRLKRTDAPFEAKKNAFVQLMNGTEPLIIEGTLVPTGIAKGWLNLDGFPAGMGAFMDIFNILPQGTTVREGKRFKVEVGLNGFGLVVTQLAK